MNKKLLITVIVGSLVFIGCAEKNVTKELVAVDDNHSIVIKKSIKDCKEYGIVLDEKRTNDFIRRSPIETINKAVKNTGKTPKKLCQFFVEETSLEKAEKVDKFTSKIVKSCEKNAVILAKQAIRNKVQNLPLFVINKGLAMERDSSVEECELMAKKYK